MRSFVTGLLMILLTVAGLPASELAGVAREVFERANAVRTARGLTACVWNDQLAKAGEIHCRDMCQLNFFGHDSPVSKHASVRDRIAEAGGPPAPPAENLYWCSGLAPARIPKSAVEEWMSSSEHRENLLWPTHTTMGIGIFRKGKEYWVTQVFQ